MDRLMLSSRFSLFGVVGSSLAPLVLLASLLGLFLFQLEYGPSSLLSSLE